MLEHLGEGGAQQDLLDPTLLEIVSPAFEVGKIALTARVLLHLGRDRRRAIDAGDVYYLEATGETTLVLL